MALTTNKIGAFTFIALMGERVPPAQVNAIDSRAGVQGEEFTLLGKKGQPFAVVSQVDADDYNAAWTTFNSYLAACASDAVEMIQGGISTVAEGYKVKVLAVTPVRIITIRGASGNKQAAAPNTGFVEARWDLIAVPI